MLAYYEVLLKAEPVAKATDDPVVDPVADEAAPAGELDSRLREGNVRFTVTGEWDHNRLLQVVVVLYSFFVILLWFTNWMLYFDAMDLTTASVVDHYLGNEEEYRAPADLPGDGRARAFPSLRDGHAHDGADPPGALRAGPPVDQDLA